MSSTWVMLIILFRLVHFSIWSSQTKEPPPVHWQLCSIRSTTILSCHKGSQSDPFPHESISLSSTLPPPQSHFHTPHPIVKSSREQETNVFRFGSKADLRNVTYFSDTTRQPLFLYTYVPNRDTSMSRFTVHRSSKPYRKSQTL